MEPTGTVQDVVNCWSLSHIRRLRRRKARCSARSITTSASFPARVASVASSPRLKGGDEGVLPGDDTTRWRMVARLPNGHFAIWWHDARDVTAGWLEEVNIVRGSED